MRVLSCTRCVLLCCLAFVFQAADSMSWNIADAEVSGPVRKSSTVPMETWKKEKLEPHFQKAVQQSMHAAIKRSKRPYAGDDNNNNSKGQKVGMSLHDGAGDDCKDNKNYTEFCSIYRDNFFCNMYPYGMQKHCALTCGFCKCKAKIDIVFLVDSSASIEKSGKGNYKKCLDFIATAVNGSFVSETFTHIGVVLFSSKTKTVFNLKQYYDVDNMTEAIAKAPHLKGGTLTGRALTYVRQEIFNKTGRKGVPQILIVMTDGKSSDGIKRPAKELHKDGVTVFAIGIGRAYDISELIEIASKPDVKYALTSDFNRLNDLYTSIRDDACRVNSTLYDQRATEDHQSFVPHSPHLIGPVVAVLKSKSNIESQPQYYHHHHHYHHHVKHGRISG